MPADRRPNARGRGPAARGGRPGSAARGRTTAASRSRTTGGAKRPTARGTGRPADRGRTRTPAKAASTTKGGKGGKGAKSSRAISPEPPSTTRLTGRAGVLVLVLAVLAVSYASSLRAYLQQRGEIQEYQRTIAERRVDIADLEREKKRWQDPNFVRAQARERLGYVMPGETPFVVVRDGKPLETESALTDPDSVAPGQPKAWWDTAWESVGIAGDPQRRTRPPLSRVNEDDGAGAD